MQNTRPVDPLEAVPAEEIPLRLDQPARQARRDGRITEQGPGTHRPFDLGKQFGSDDAATPPHPDDGGKIETPSVVSTRRRQQPESLVERGDEGSVQASSSAAVIVGTGTPRASTASTVQRPVPFCPARSQITSSRRTPGASAAPGVLEMRVATIDHHVTGVEQRDEVGILVRLCNLVPVLIVRRCRLTRERYAGMRAELEQARSRAGTDRD